MGFCNRVVPPGAARRAAEALAAEIASFPQMCLRADRQSALESLDHGLETAMRRELGRARAVLDAPEMVAGAERFVEGAGRGGELA
jgi:enoyl-CoA hydratase